jgi:2-iminobutanoate/2-iminopropanoate deaminase
MALEQKLAAVQTPLAPAAVGPYSQAVRAGDFICISGQLGLSPETGELVPGGVAAQARQALANIAAIAEAAGGTLSDVARTRIYLTDMADFAVVNAVYAEAFGACRPARVTVGVSALPRGGAAEIEADLWLGKGQG